MEIYEARLEASSIPLVEAVDIVNNAKTCILNNTSQYGEANLN